ncbi:MAG: hypothetical protein ACRBEQ_08535 [Hyphomonas sp.]
MKYLLMGAAAIALLTACGKKGDDVVADGQEISEAVKSGKLPKIKLRAGDAATAEQALEAFSLGENTEGLIQYESRELKGEKATFTDVRFNAGEEDSPSVAIGEITFEGLGMIDEQANFSRVVVSDLTFTPPEDEPKGKGTIDTLELVNPSPEMAAWMAKLLAGTEPDELKPEDVTFDKLALSDLDFTMDEPDGESGVFTLAGIEFIGVTEDMIAGVTLDNLVMDMENPTSDTDVKASIGGINIRGLDIGLLQNSAGNNPITGMSGPTELMSGLSGTARSDDPANPGYEIFELDDLDMNVGGAIFAMPKLSSNVKRDKKGRTTNVSVAPFKATLAVAEGELGEKLGAQLASLGYETLEFTGQAEQNYDPENDMLTIVDGKNYYELNDGFRLDFAGKYEGTKAIALMMEEAGDEATSADAVMDNLEAIVLHNFSISLDDNGIVDRGFSAYAAQTGQDPAELRAQVSGMMAMAPMMAGGSGVDPALINEVASALSSFITEPKTLTLSLNPSEPLSAASFEGLDDPSALTKEVLGFSANNE